MRQIRRFVPNLHSIRWRLPLSYAGLALLTALALTGVLLFALRSHYDQREKTYLEASAHALTNQAERMYRDQQSITGVQQSINLLAFLAQARIQWLNTDQQIVFDSGPVDELEPVNVNFGQRDPAQQLDGSDERPPQLEPYITILRNPPPEEDQSVRYPWPSRRDSFGQFLADDASPGEHSDQHLTSPVYGPDGEIIGYFTLSEGPAFGSEIVESVAEKGAIAGVIAVLLAAGMGVVFSRNINHPVLALAEATQQMAHGDLSARVNLVRRDEFGVLAGTFNTMAERVETTVRTLTQFVADAAHEINTPLTALRTNLELAVAGGASDTTQTDIQQALDELKRLEMLTRSLLTLAHLEAADVQSSMEVIDATALVRQIYERYASRAEQAGITLVLESPPGPVWFRARQAEIERLLSNLLDNALKFTPQGGCVTLAMTLDGEQMRLAVHDTGIGIPPDDLPKLFSRFHRGRNAAAYPGNGLGLVISKAIVTDHGGRITVESGSGGTCFTVELPVLTQKEAGDDDLSDSVDRG